MKLLIEKGKTPRPQRVVIYAPEGLGKSTLASQLPSPIFLDFEDGTAQLDVDRVKPENLAEAVGFLDSLCKDARGYKTVVIDTIDWMEEAMVRDVVASAENAAVKSIEDFGYGKGYVHLSERMQRILACFDRCIAAGLHVVLLAHTSVVKFDDPAVVNPYDRFELKLYKDRKGKGSAALVKEWCDALLLGRFDDKVRTQGDGAMAKTKAVAGSGKVRVLYCTHSAAWDAKNRHGLADVEPWGIQTLQRILGSADEPAAAKPEAKPEAKPAPAPKPVDTPQPAPQAEAGDDEIPGVVNPAKEDKELDALFGKHEEGMNRLCVIRKWIVSGQTYRDVSTEIRTRMLANPDGVIAMVKALPKAA
jgi:hypothetical protein